MVAEYALDPADRRGLDDWLGHAEAAAWAAGAEGGDGALMPVEWEGFHVAALDDLCSVAEVAEVAEVAAEVAARAADADRGGSGGTD